MRALYLLAIVSGCVTPPRVGLVDTGAEAADTGTGPDTGDTEGGHRLAGCVATIDIDNDANGALDQRRRLEHDELGREVLSAYDIDLDGAFDESVVKYTYDADHMIRRESDPDGDGAFRRRTEYLYDDGKLSRVEAYEADVLRSVTTYHYDDGVLYRITHDADLDGSFEWSSAITVDAAGNILRDERTGEDGVSITEYEYDSSGRRVATFQDNDGDGVVDWTTTYTRGPYGLTEASVDWGDGVVWTLLYVYDQDGRLETMTQYEGTPATRVERYAWSCPS